jgi:hypothetical protein
LPFCTKCGKLLPADVRFCPSCGTPTAPLNAPEGVATPQVKVSHTKRNIALAVALLLLILVLAGAAYKPSPETTGQNSPTIVQTTTPGKQYDAVIRYTERYDKTIDFAEASQGNTFLVVTLEIHNNIDQAFSTNPYHFYIIASSVKYDLDSATYLLPDPLQSVEVLKGGTVTGSIAFQVPALTSSYELFYEAPFTSFDINWIHNVAATPTQESREQQSLLLQRDCWGQPLILSIHGD